MNLTIWAILALVVSLAAGLVGYPGLLRRSAARLAKATFLLFLMVFIALVVLVVFQHG